MTGPGQAYINVELRRESSGNYRVRASSSNGSLTESVDLRTFEVPEALITNVYLTVDPLPDNKYQVRFKSDRNPSTAPPDDTPDDIVLVASADIPTGLSTAWLSLRGQASGGPSVLARFDQVDISGQPGGDVVEDFGGPLPPPPPPEAPLPAP